MSSTKRFQARERGFTFVEVLISSVVLSIVVLAAVTYQTSSHRANNKLKDRAFATQRAIQMMEELRGYVNGGLETNIDVLDGYDDGAVFTDVLTTDKKVSNPADALSGNVTFNGGWKFIRRVSVRRLPEAPNARWVQVRVYYANGGDVTKQGESLAEVTSILKTVGNVSVPTQSLDVYILALENVPGWWSNLATLRPMFDNSITDLESRNPGLEIRRHWITRVAYGRDPFYTPHVNVAANANASSIGQVYFYPGMLDLANNKKYYEPANMTGRINLDGTVTNANSTTDPSTGYTTTPYSLADNWNHGMRYPEEVAKYNAALALDPNLEPSLRMLLEEMNTNPSKYTNALVVNLHGELLPLPPMRNFSDPAKDPRPSVSGGLPYVRAVTHPERLYYAGGDSVALRVYTFLSNPGAVGVPSTAHAFVVLKNVSSNVTIDSVLQLDAADSVWVNHPTFSSTSGSDIVIDLPSSKLSRTQLPTKRGLPTTKRLYGMDYIPCPIGGNFLKDLRDNGATARPKNTAEWRIKMHYTGNGMLTVETRLGDPVLNTPWSDYPNLSRTYTWIGTATPPLTERYQFMGDPRHSPYADVFQYFGYNWYFASVDTNDYKKMYKTVNGWGSSGSQPDIDIPRYFSMWRKAMLSSTSLWTNMTGFSFYYIGLGGEFGADASNGYGSGLPISGDPWNLNGSQNVDEITNGASVTNCRIPAKIDLTWYSKPWLGELYPDDYYTVGSGAGWDTKGNLPTGAGNYYRAPYNFAGTPFAYQRQHRTAAPGCASLFNGKGSGSTGPFRHEYRDNDMASITSNGLNLSGRFNLGLPSSMSASRPFTLNYNSTWPVEWNDTAYVNTRTTTAFFQGYYDAPYSASYRSSASVRLTQGGKTAYFMMNGLSPQTSSGSAWMARYALVSMVQSFMDAGDPSYAGWLPQLPRVQVVTPDPNDDITDPTSLSVTWNTDWKRWDLQNYNIPGYTPTAVAMHYVMKFSNDGGRTWKYVDDNSTAEAGVRPVDSNGNDLHTVSQPFAWDVSALARGTYIIRLEAYRQSTHLHYSYHQVQIYIKRTVS